MLPIDPKETFVTKGDIRASRLGVSEAEARLLYFFGPIRTVDIDVSDVESWESVLSGVLGGGELARQLLFEEKPNRAAPTVKGLNSVVLDFAATSVYFEKAGVRIGAFSGTIAVCYYLPFCIYSLVSFLFTHIYINSIFFFFVWWFTLILLLHFTGARECCSLCRAVRSPRFGPGRSGRELLHRADARANVLLTLTPEKVRERTVTDAVL